MSKKQLRIGLIGTGFMGRTHSNGYNRVSNFFPELEYTPVLKAVCSRNLENVKAFAEQWGYESVETDWKALIARDDIDAIDISGLPRKQAVAIKVAGPQNLKRIHSFKSNNPGRIVAFMEAKTVWHPIGL